MSKRYFLRNILLYDLPKCSCKIRNTQVGNGQICNVLFMIPEMLNIHSHFLKSIYMLVSEIYESVDLVLGLKIMSGLESDLSTRDSWF